MPRIRLRRTLLYLLVVGGFTMIVVNIHHLSGVQMLKESTSMALRSNANANNERVDDVEIKNSLLEAAAAAAAAVDQQHQQQQMHPHSAFDDVDGTPWFMKGGWLRPKPAVVDRMTNQRTTALFPHESDDDRIVEQLMFVPPVQGQSKVVHQNTIGVNATSSASASASPPQKLKKILVYHGLQNWAPVMEGRDTFVRDKCPVNTCEVTADREQAESADAILFRDHVNFHQPLAGVRRPWSQVWILYLLECPYHTETFPYKNLFNWTATYRHDSDIVAPYEKFVPFPGQRKLASGIQTRNFAANKTKKVAWFVSNCAAHNSRMEFAEQLGQHIAVDIYGACGSLQCPRTSDRCFGLLNRDYKFYLSFENSNCKDYITEKFFVNGLGNDVVPIVMGARREDYERASPPHSFIHVEDFDSPKELARYLYLLDSNDTLYNEYFRWKGSGEFVNTYFWCRLCAMLHEDKHVSKVYEDINAWWRGPGTCVSKTWKKTAPTTTSTSTSSSTVTTFHRTRIVQTQGVDKLNSNSLAASN